MKKIGLALTCILLVISSHTFAAKYAEPENGQDIIGEIQYTPATGNKPSMIAQSYDVGFNAIQNANPQVNISKDHPSNVALQIPTKHLLPNLPHRGIIVNLPEMRLYYYPGTGQVLTYPIGIGKIGKTIPITNTVITRKAENPTWIPPDDIREFNLEQGIVLPKIMPPGPDNPLGTYAIYMRLPTYLIHSTIFPQSVGKRASFGCIRMYESDIKDFFPLIKPGIPVAIINAPVKLGWQNDKLYMEVHEPLEEHDEEYDASLPGMVHLIQSAAGDQPVLIDWQLLSYLAKDRDGIPHEIGRRLK